ncbi:MAG TPA: amino acid adenylation domain-containing protein, partial [Ktedonobacteraceae bacterium]
MNLRDLAIRRAEMTPQALAVKGPDVSLTYGELNSMANRFAHALAQLGVQHGDRVGIWLDKSPYAVAAMQGVLRLRAIYVPLDPLSPASRIGTIIRDCDIRTLITTQKRAETGLASDLPQVSYLCLDTTGPGMTWGDLMEFPDTPVAETESDENEVAYILYTSGSTGKPKGVCISNRNALAFIEWALHTLEARPSDRFANHAPFHFDLSVLDLYVAFAAGASVFLIPDTVSSLPQYLVNCIIHEQLTVWYSVPSVLILMMDHGGLLELELDSLPLRAILFAGEPFPIKHLRRLHQRWSKRARLLNLYGPTETNVCTFYEVTHLPEDQVRPVPIGKSSSGDYVWAQKDDRTIAGPGETGELMVEGPTVMVGYWGQPEQGNTPYATGDLVQLQEDGDYVYLGRRDHMMKVRGYRIEPGEIEAALEQHPAISEAAVITA